MTALDQGSPAREPDTVRGGERGARERGDPDRLLRQGQPRRRPNERGPAPGQRVRVVSGHRHPESMPRGEVVARWVLGVIFRE